MFQLTRGSVQIFCFNTKEENEPPQEGGEEKNPEAERARRTRIEIRKEERPKVRQWCQM